MDPARQSSGLCVPSFAACGNALSFVSRFLLGSEIWRVRSRRSACSSISIQQNHLRGASHHVIPSSAEHQDLIRFIVPSVTPFVHLTYFRAAYHASHRIHYQTAIWATYYACDCFDCPLTFAKMSPTDWSSLKVVDLRAELSNRGLLTKGVKAELIARLNEDDAAQAETPEVQDEATSGEAAPFSNEPEPEAPLQKTNTDVAAIDPSSAANPEPAVVAEAQPVAADKLAADETSIDLQTRKRRSSRSRTPPPSAKRARQEHEREAEDREDVVDFDTGDIAESVHDAKANGIENGHTAQERTTTQGQAVEEHAQNAQEGSSEEACPKQAATAGPFDDPKPSSPAKEAPSEISGEEAYSKRVAIAESLKAASPPANEIRAFNDKDGDVEMEDAETAGSSKGAETSMRSQQTSEARGAMSKQGGDASQETDDLTTPSTYRPTSALYIRELMRPLRPEVMEQHVIDLITSEGNDSDPELIEEFYIDQIRTHAFVQLTSVSAAKRVRAALHNQIWPNESNRKPLWVDFVPSSQVKEWITEESAESGAQSKRWEVVYEQQGGEIVAVHTTVGSNSKPFSKPPPTGPAAGPTYPGIEAAPRGPRGRGGGSRLETPNSLMTQAHPRLSYTPLSNDVARRRVDNMRSFYSKNAPSDLGKDYHRFTFENTDSFVDRGVEVFIGIRPPHREKEHQERLRREQSGTAGASSAAESRRDEFRPRPAGPAEDRFPRYGDNRRPDRRGRNRGFRGDRGPRRFGGDDPYRYRPGY